MSANAGRTVRPEVGLSAAARAEGVEHRSSPAARLTPHVRWQRFPDGVVWQTLDIWWLDGLIHGQGESRDVPSPLPSTDPASLRDPARFEHFVERIFARGRLARQFSGSWTVGELVEFHTDHKLQLFAHDPGRARDLGRLVAGAETEAGREQSAAVGRSEEPASGPRSAADVELAEAYRYGFAVIMATPPSRGRRADALLHAAGHLPGKAAGAAGDLPARIEAYRQGEVPFRDPLDLLAALASSEHIAYLARQTIFEPYPADLRSGE